MFHIFFNVYQRVRLLDAALFAVQKAQTLSHFGSVAVAEKTRGIVGEKKHTLFLIKYPFLSLINQHFPNDPLENQMMKTNFESHKQNQTNK